MDWRRDRMLVSGFVPDGVSGAATYSLDLATMAWSALAPDGPVPPAHDLVFYDTAGDRMIAVGGPDTFGYYPVPGETWVLTFSGATTGVGDLPKPSTLKLFGSPNPFTSKIDIEFDLAHRGPATLTIFDIAGRRARSMNVGELGEGHHSVSWTGLNDAGELVPSGIYFIRLDAAGLVETMQIVFMRK
jgi:hypothetical protein